MATPARLDRTHEYDAAYELVETIYGGHGSRGGVDDHLENGVYSFQYHPELPAIRPRTTARHAGLCALPINLAERKNFWIASQRELYQRMPTTRTCLSGARRRRAVTVANPTIAHRRDGGRAAASVRERMGWR